MNKRPKIKVRVHKAFFVGDKGNAHFFVNIANVAKHRQLTIAHIAFEHHSETIDIIPTTESGSLLLPCTLEPSDCIEIPIPAKSLPKEIEENQEYVSFKVRDTDGNWYESKKQHTLLNINRVLTIKTSYE